MITKEKENKVERHYFKIEGEYFTWLLRHLWIEGNELKAIKFWISAFPNISETEHIKTVFLDIVSGKKKLVGTNTFDLVEDGTKYWSPTPGGKPSKSFPLLQSWEDVILLKKANLYLSEIELREFRLSRRYGNTIEDCEFSSLRWLTAAEENNTENGLRSKTNEYYTSLLNICLTIKEELEFDLVPQEISKKSTFRRKFLSVGRGTTGDNYTELNGKIYEEILNTISPVQKYFENKYGQSMLWVNYDNLKSICDYKEARYREEKLSNEPSAFVSGLTGALLGFERKGLSLDNFVKGRIEESNRKEIKAEDVSKTNWCSGYINKNGDFYGCSDLGHSYFSKDLCKLLKIRGSGDEKFDGEIFLDSDGWIKVSMSRFYWDDKLTVTQAQKDTMFDYMKAKNINSTIFQSCINPRQTFEEFFGEEK